MPTPERKLPVREAQYAVLAIGRGILTVGVILGALIIIGGRVRWSSPSYETALTYPYAPESWGYVLGVISLAGILGSILGRFRMVAVALFVVAVWCFFFSLSFIQTAWSNPSAATTGIPIYLGAAVCSLLVGNLHWRSSGALHE